MLFIQLLYTLLKLLAQVAPDPNDLTFTGALLLVSLPGIAGLVGTFLYDGAKTIIPWYDHLNPKIHQVASPIFNFLFGFFIVGKLHLTGVDSVAGLDTAWFTGSFTMLASSGIFRYFKRKSPSDATLLVEKSRESQPL